MSETQQVEQPVRKQVDIASELALIEGRPFIRNPLAFFESTRNFRTLLSFTDTDAWKHDLVLAEKMFGTLFVSTSSPNSQESIQQVRDVLKQRLKYPGIQENPELLKLAKIWILPTKVHTVPEPSKFLEDFAGNMLPKQEELKFETLSCVKFEFSAGQERMLIYKMLDDGFRPALLLVKWSQDLDEHFPTAYCAGHLMNSGYVMIDNQNGYALYYFCGAPMYDTVSMKELTYGNPFARSFQDQTVELLKSLQLSKIESTDVQSETTAEIDSA